jgi:DNA topoisomerase-1
VLSIGANRAIDLIVQKESGGGSRFSRGPAEPARVLGDHPEGGAVSVKSGRFGPYVNWGKVNATIPRAVDPASLTLEQALELIAEKAAGGGGGATGGRALGDHPDGGKITVRAGRFGPYVSWGKINATLPKGASADEVTLDEALRLIEEKGGAPKKSAKKAPAKKAPANKPPAKAKKKIEDSDETPFDDSQPMKRAVKAAAKKTATKKPPAKKTASKTKKAAAS